jgi:hypothetical protein
MVDPGLIDYPSLCITNNSNNSSSNNNNSVKKVLAISNSLKTGNHPSKYSVSFGLRKVGLYV